MLQENLKKNKSLETQVKKEAMSSSSNLWLRELKAEISFLLDRESWIWSQRSRVQWLSNCDQNTRYFHSRDTKRHRENLIVGIRDASQSWQDNPEKIAFVLLKYYVELFSSAVLDQIPRVITNDMNSTLLAKFLEWEVKMAPLKAPKPDGMPPFFYQNFWNAVDHDVVQLILSWLNTGTLPTLLIILSILSFLKFHIQNMLNNITPLASIMSYIKYFLRS